MTRRPRTRWTAAVMLLAVAALTSACSSGSESPTSVPSSSPTTASASASTPAASPTAPASAPPAPKAGACYAITRGQALGSTMPSRAVPCATAHTAQTYRVGTFDLVRNGHLLAIDSRQAGEQVLNSCTDALAGWLDGDPRLSVLTPNWFTPTIEQSDAGAAWYRCDVVALNGARKLAELPATTRGVLSTEQGRGQYGLCRTEAPGKPRSSPVPCGQPHAYRAIRIVDLPGTTLPSGKAGQAALDSPCQDAAAAIASDPLKVAWEQELPTAAQWDAGRRYGICWVPTR